MSAIIRFHGDLKKLARPYKSDGVIVYPTERSSSLKDVIEALGPPHTEVHRLAVDGRETGFDAQLADGQNIDVHPATPPVNPLKDTPLRPALPEIRFLADVNVGRLARLLRLLGFDTAWGNDWDDEFIADLAEREGRIVLSTDRRLLKRRKIEHGRLVLAAAPREQLREILDLYGLTGPFAPFSRCLYCNVKLAPVEKNKILHRLQPLTKKYFDEFHLCPQCERIYWPGSHHDGMTAMLKEMGLAKEPEG